MCVKAIAIYRDNCKVSQPLSTAKRAEAVEPLGDALIPLGAAPQIVEKIVEKVVEKVIQVPTREKLPRQRTTKTFDFRVADCQGFVTVGELSDRRPGASSLRVPKHGSPHPGKTGRAT